MSVNMVIKTLTSLFLFLSPPPHISVCLSVCLSLSLPPPPHLSLSSLPPPHLSLSLSLSLSLPPPLHLSLSLYLSLKAVAGQISVKGLTQRRAYNAEEALNYLFEVS